MDAASTAVIASAASLCLATLSADLCFVRLKQNTAQTRLTKQVVAQLLHPKSRFFVMPEKINPGIPG